MVQVVIAAGNPLERKYLEILMKKESKKFHLIHSVGEFHGIEEICQTERVDLIIIDIDTVNDLNGLEGVKQIKEQFPDIKMLIITGQPECSYPDRAKELQIESFWYKTSEKIELLEVMKQTVQGVSVYPRQILSVPIGNIMSSDFSKRELDVLRELVRGSLDSEIAERLHISLRTVKTHIQHMRDKTGFRNRTELAVQARGSGLIINEKPKIQKSLHESTMCENLESAIIS